MENIEIRGNDIYFNLPDGGKSGEGGQDKLLYTWDKGLYHIVSYLNNKPDSNWLWVKPNGKKMSSSWVRLHLDLLKVRTGIKKPLTPHKIRHGGVTRLRRLKIQDHVIKRIAGWSKKSNQIEQYSHLCADDYNDVIREKVNGKKEDRREKVTECPSCHRTDISEDFVFCPYCQQNLQYSKEETNEMLKERLMKEIREEFSEEKQRLEEEIQGYENGDMFKDMQREIDFLNENFGSFLRIVQGEELSEKDKEMKQALITNLSL